MAIDISIVLFRPDANALRPLFASLRSAKSEFRYIRVLISGTDSEFLAVVELLAEFSLTYLSIVLHRYDNLGFASGHNLLLENAFVANADLVCVMNPDIVIVPGSIDQFIRIIAAHGTRALYGPSLKRISDKSSASIDSMGIEWTRTARHFDAEQGGAWRPLGGVVREVAGATGACLFVTRDAYERVTTRTGWFFDDFFLAYREDAELGIRAGLVGVPSRLIEIEGFSHERAVRGPQRGKALPDFLGVQNRFLMKWRLGKHRPGNRILSSVRDLVVLFAALTVERNSWGAVHGAYRIRRWIKRSAPWRS